MLNRYQANPAEFLRRARVIAAGMTYREAWQFLGDTVQEFSVALNTRQSGSSVAAAYYIWVALKGGEVPDGPYIPQTAPDSAPGPICLGCGGVGDAPRMLRWAKVARGEPVLVSEDVRGKPEALAWLTPKVIMKEWFGPWEVDTSIRFQFITEGEADIRIAYQYIDGPGKTQGFVWVPDQSLEHMEQGGDLAGDMRLDLGEDWANRSKASVNEVGEHEGGHAIGMPHTEGPDDVLYPYTSGRRKKQTDNDKRAKTLRYPPKANPA